MGRILGPTRARKAWRTLGVDGLGLADAPPSAEMSGDFLPRLTVPMVARLQGFPGGWAISGRKTAAYRQVGNAFPPPVARAVGRAIWQALQSEQINGGNVLRGEGELLAERVASGAALA